MAEPQVKDAKSVVAAEDLTGKTVGRFAVRAKLGSGGMGEVYLADDPKLKRSVALKRLAPRLRADQSFRQRFLTEAQRASALNDAHIAQVYDVFEEKEAAYLVMEHVEGSTLRRRLERPLSIPEFLDLAVQCVQALAAAHERGVLHCDLKPENIMLTPAGRVKVLDFGVAKRLPSNDQGSLAQTTDSDPGKLSGTPAYMSPEILLMRPPDARADIFSLGVVFYETLTGRHPFLATGFVATSDRILHETPPPLTNFNPQVSRALDGVIAKMLAKIPEERYPSAAELLSDLRALGQTATLPAWSVVRRSLPGKRRVAWGSAAVTGLVLLAFFVPALRREFQHGPGGPPVPQQKQLAVLPFTAVGGTTETAAFANGLAETLTARLTQLSEKHSLEVIPASVVRSKGVSTLRQAREEFGVNLGLEGSLQQSGGMVRVTYNLIDANTLRQLRGDTITAKASDPFALEDQVAGSVLRALEIELQPQERQVFSAHGTTQPAAYDYYLQGRGYMQDFVKPENIESAIAVFNRALEDDPHYALAYAGLGEAYGYKYYFTKESVWVAKSRAACEQAIIFKGDQAEGHNCLGGVFGRTGEYEKAVSQFRRAIDLEPTNDFAYAGLAGAYEGLGNVREAEKTYLRAISLRPNYWAGYNALGAFYFEHGRYAEAAAMFERMVARVPDSFVGYQNLGGTYAYQGRYAEAIPVLERSVSIRPTAGASSNLGTAYFELHRYSDAARLYEEAVKLSGQEFELWGNLGDAYYWAPGRRGEAAGAYRKAISLASGDLTVNPRDAKTLSFVAYYHAMLGEKQPALSTLRRAVQMDPHNVELLSNAALIYNQLGDTAHTLEWLERALAGGFPPTMVRNTPNFDALRDNPRFQVLMKKY